MSSKGKLCICPGLFHRKAPPADYGRVMVPSLNRMISFRIVRPSSDTGANRASTGTGPCLLTTPTAADSKKVHIKWNIDPTTVQDLAGDNEVEESSDWPNVKSQPSDSSSQRTCSQEVIDMTADPHLHLAYDNGQRIEYFSVTHQRWMSGTINSDICQSSTAINVSLTHGNQLRANVGLDLLRAPLKAGDLVELYSGQQGRLYLPAVIAAEQSSAPSLLGYRVVIEGSKETFDNVPPLRLKRRFLRGQQIEVYRGPALGWQRANVHHTASADGCEAEVLRMPFTPATTSESSESVAPGVHQRCMSSPRQSEPMQSLSKKQCTASGIGIWSVILVCVDTKEADTPESVPSYLVRPTSTCTI